MKSGKKVLCLLLAFCLLISLFVGCHKNNDPTDPTATTQGEDGPNNIGPKRPDSLGVIAPLSEETAIPEDGIVWNMENTPDDLIESSWAAPVHASDKAFIPNNISIYGAAGKGYDDSRALGIQQIGNYCWADVYTIGLVQDDTACTNWKGGEMFWLWFNSTESNGSPRLELEVNAAHLASGTAFYVMEDGGEVAAKGGKCPEAYDGAGYARIPIPANTKGWIGVPLSAYDTSLRRVTSVKVHVTDVKVGGSLYLDNFCVTSGGIGPMGAELSDVNAHLATSDKPAWDMENIPDDLLSASWASIEGASWDGFKSGNINVFGAAGKGVNGSRALQIRQNGPYSGCDVVGLGITNDKTSYTDWSEGEYLWFWVNTKGLRVDLRLDIQVDGQKPAIGTPYYGINNDLQIQKAGVFDRAWDTATYGRMVIGKGYEGWVGIPLSAFGTVEEVLTLTLHLAYAGSDVEGSSVYFDEFWVLKEGEIPKDAFGASVYVLAGGIKDSLGATAELPCQVWNFEGIPANLLNSKWAICENGGDKDYVLNNVTLFKADGKGYEGSTALGLRQNGKYCWADVFNLKLQKDSSAVRNWSNGKVVWLYVDASEQSCGIKFDLNFDQVKPKIGATMYLVEDGATGASQISMKAAWDTADYARIVLPLGFKGWVGMPLDSYKTKIPGANEMQLHVSYDGDYLLGKSIYFDALWVTADTTCPNGVKVQELSEEEEEADSKTAVWDMENIPDDLISAAWATADFASNAEYKKGNVSYLGADGKGRNGSRAMQYQFNGNYNWADEFTVNLKMDSTVATDWTGGEMLWFWVNTAGMKNEFELELWISGKKLNKDAGYYIVSGGKPVKGGNLNVAWDGNGRIPVDCSIEGFIGIPLSGYGKLDIVHDITMHCAGGGIMGGSYFYLDEFWVTKMNEVPVDAADYKVIESGGGSFTGNTVVWDMEAVPENAVAAGYVTEVHGSNAEYNPSNVIVSAVNGKGYQGSRALAFRQNGKYSWTDVYYLNLSADSTANTDWSGASFIWIWVDASEFGSTITADFLVDGRPILDGADCYTIVDGKAIATSKAAYTWNGAPSARIRIAAGYKGWFGIPFSAFKKNPTSANKIEFHMGFDGENYQGATLYLDQFMLTDATTGPENAPIIAPDVNATATKRVLDMEKLPDTLTSVITTGFGKGVLGQAVDAVKAAGKGYNGSTALGYKYLQITENNGDNILQFNLSAIGGDTDWTGGKIFWYWVDTSEMTTPLLMEVELSGKRPKNHSECYLWTGSGEITTSTLVDAWKENTTDGRVQLAAGYKGWVGIPLSAYGISLASVNEVTLYFCPDKDKDSLPKTVYFDEFWITDEGETPELS